MARVAFAELSCVCLTAVVLVAGCTLEAPVVGRACAAHADCGDEAAFYCELEVEPHVCLPQPSGVPALPNHAPIVESALILVPTEALEADASPVSGRFRARDPDGDGTSFRAETIVSELGTLVLEADGRYTFTLAEPQPTTDTSGRFQFEVLDDRQPPAVTQAAALAYVVTQPPSSQVRLWRGQDTERFDVAGGWQPEGVPDAATTVLIGPAEPGPLQLAPGASHEVNGWLSFAAAQVSLGSADDPATLIVRGTRLLSGAPLAHGTVQVASAQGFGTEVTLAGELPSLVVETDVLLEGPVHARGDVILRRAKGPLQIRSLVVDGALTQEGEVALWMISPSAVLSVAGDVRLTGGPSRFESGLLVVGGDLDVTHPSSTAGLRWRALFSGAGTAPGEDQRVRLAAPSAFRFLDAVIGREARVRFDSDAHIDGALSVLGGLGVKEGHTVEVDTVILRPSMSVLPGPSGELRARRCFIGARVEVPGFVTCDAVIEPAPEPVIDAGVAPPDEVDAGPANECPEGWMEYGNDLVEHSVLVASADPPLPASGALQVDGARFGESTVVLRTGALTLASTGTATFLPSGVDGHDEVSLDVVRDTGAGDIVTAACADVWAVDTLEMNVLVGSLWDDPASWSLGRLPSSADSVFVPASEQPHTAAAGGPALHVFDLWIATGGVLDTNGRTLRATRRLVVGGELRTGSGVAEVAGGGEVAGRVERLGCVEGMVSLLGDLRLEALLTSSSAAPGEPCGFDLGHHRLTVKGDAQLDAPLELRMQTRPATVVIEGRLQAPELTGVLQKGELQLRADVDVASWSVAAGLGHQVWVMSPTLATMPTIDYGGWLLITASELRLDDGGEVIGDTPLVFERGGSVGLLTSYRTLDVGAGQLAVDTLQVTPLFATGTPERWQVSACTMGDAEICP